MNRYGRLFGQPNLQEKKKEEKEQRKVLKFELYKQENSDVLFEVEDEVINKLLEPVLEDDGHTFEDFPISLVNTLCYNPRNLKGIIDKIMKRLKHANTVQISMTLIRILLMLRVVSFYHP